MARAIGQGPFATKTLFSGLWGSWPRCPPPSHPPMALWISFDDGQIHLSYLDIWNAWMPLDIFYQSHDEFLWRQVPTY